MASGVRCVRFVVRSWCRPSVKRCRVVLRGSSDGIGFRIERVRGMGLGPWLGLVGGEVGLGVAE